MTRTTKTTRPDTAAAARAFIETEIEGGPAILALVDSRKLRLIPDPQVRMVWGLVDAATELAVAVIYLADDDFEVNEERLEAIAPPLGDDDRAWLADCLADDDDDEPTDSDAQAIDEAAELVASTSRDLGLMILRERIAQEIEAMLPTIPCPDFDRSCACSLCYETHAIRSAAAVARGQKTKPRPRGHAVLKLDERQARALLALVSKLEAGAAERNSEHDDKSARGELVAARAVIRHLAELGVTS